MKRKSNQKKYTENLLKAKKQELPKNCIIQITNIGDNISREDILSSLEDVCKPKFLDFSRNSKEGYIRFESEEEAKKCLEMEKPLILNEKEAVLSLLTGIIKTIAVDEKEEEYLLNIMNNLKRRNTRKFRSSSKR